MEWCLEFGVCLCSLEGPTGQVDSLTLNAVIIVVPHAPLGEWPKVSLKAQYRSFPQGSPAIWD